MRGRFCRPVFTDLLNLYGIKFKVYLIRMSRLFVLICCVGFLAKVNAHSCYWSSTMMNATTDFFDQFNFETMNDPTNGYVDYVDQTTGKDYGLISYTNDQIYIGVDYTNNVNDWERGRKSIRLSSKRVISGNNLVVIDLEHMPTTAGSALSRGCSIWPAFWTCGSNWPNNGEIDLIEYVNTDSTVATTLHTSDGCDQASESTSSFSGYWSTGPYGGPNDNCYVYASDQYSNTGCNIVGASNAVGNAFNTNDQSGGVFAMEWTKDSEIRAFYFPRNSVPSDLTGHTPNPDSWGLPYARFQIGDNCPSSHFVDHNIIFDNTFCGDWAGAVFNSQCATSTSCTDFVKWNPSEFRDAYWLINYVEVYDAC